MKKIISSSVIVFLAFFVSLAPINTSVAAETGPFYIGVLGGYSFGSDLEYDEPSFPSYDLDIQDTWALGAKFGYTMPFAKFFALELEYLYLNPDIDRKVLESRGIGFTAIEGDLDMNSIMFNFILKYPEGIIHPFIGGGLGFSYVDFTRKKIAKISGITSTYSNSYDDTAFAWQLLAGVNFEINKHLSVDLTYRYFMTNSEYDYDEDYDDHYGYHHDRPEIKFKSSIATIGLNYHF
jgi:opacity protein-like surface antigen